MACTYMPLLYSIFRQSPSYAFAFACFLVTIANAATANPKNDTTATADMESAPVFLVPISDVATTLPALSLTVAFPVLAS